jgi:hypothetical protein
LIAERLAATRREHDECVLASEHRLDSRLLARPKSRVAEMLRERGARGVERERRGILLHGAVNDCVNMRMPAKRIIILAAHA